jgi:hypothetical protein
VIIRVLCLLIARDGDEEETIDLRTADQPADKAQRSVVPLTVHDLWPDLDANTEDRHLPARRRRLVRGRH